MKNRSPVLVFGQRELESRVARGEVPAPCLVSIVEPRRPFRRAREDERTPPAFRRAFREVLTLHFSDVPEGTTRVPGSRPPSRADARRIVRFARARAGEGGFAVHCWAGICRSAAAAMGILHVLGRSEEEALRDLLSVRPYARPHPGLLAHFDALLGSRLAEVAADPGTARLEVLRRRIRARAGRAAGQGPVPMPGPPHGNR